MTFRLCRGAGVVCVLMTIVVVAFAQPAIALAPVPSADVRVETQRFAGSDRYGTAVALARAAFPGWSGVRSVVIASGEQSAVSDALVAATLTGAVDGPLLLVQRDRVPLAAADALREIGAIEGTVSVFVIGGVGSVSEQCVAEVVELLGDGPAARRVAGADRYVTAAAVGSLVASLAADSADGWPGLVLLVNGESRFGFADALGASAAGAASSVPVLLVQRDAVPGATRSTLAALGASETVVIGGRGVVSDAAAAAVNASERWHGSDRYGTAAAVARKLWERGVVARGSAVVACSVADAAACAQLAASGGGPVLLVRSSGVPAPTAACLTEGDPPVGLVSIAGGAAAVPPGVERELRGAPHPPEILSPKPGSLTGGKASVSVRTGVNTREVRLYSGSMLVAAKAASPFSEVTFGIQSMPPSGTALRVVAVASDGGLSETAARYRRLAYPASTSIVIDKSDFRLYWVKGDVLVKSYPVAIGRPHMETPVAMWRIGAKYYTDPAGIYGPRKMRLFRRVVSGDSVRYVYTRYNIHGTNQPWVIGTKASHGCIRMYNRDVLDLFPRVPLGALVQTRE